MRHRSWARRQLASCAFALALVAGITSAHAAQVTYQFQGTVASVDSGLSGSFSSGDTISGTFTVESTTPVVAGSDANTAVYHALVSLGFSLGASFTASTAGAPEVQIGNQGGGEFSDRYAVVARGTDGLGGSPIPAGTSLAAFILRVDQNAGTLFGNADGGLPTAFTLADFDTSNFFLFFNADSPDSPFVVAGTLTQLNQIPEPATLALLGTVLLGAGIARRRRATG